MRKVAESVSRLPQPVYPHFKFISLAGWIVNILSIRFDLRMKRAKDEIPSKIR